MASSSSSSSRPPPRGGISKTPAQKYPKTTRRAASLMGHLQALSKKGPRTLVGTVVDTSFHLSQGYVTATTQLGIVSVYSVPYGQVVPQMRIYCRQIGGTSSTRSFVFDGFAPNISRLGKSGSLCYTATAMNLGGVGIAQTSTNGSTSTQSAIPAATGYYWHLFFYMPVLPTSPVTLLAMVSQNDVSVGVTLSYLPSGYLQFSSIADGKGYLTTTAVPPHSVHWVVIQPGLSGLEVLIDGMPPAYQGLSGAGDIPSFSGGGTSYTMSLLSNPDGTSLVPLGTWVSKVGFGSSWNGTSVIPLVQTVPAADTDLPQGANAATTTSPTTLFICDDSVRSNQLIDNAYIGADGTLTVNTSFATILETGPF